MSLREYDCRKGKRERERGEEEARQVRRRVVSHEEIPLNLALASRLGSRIDRWERGRNGDGVFGDQGMDGPGRGR